MAYQKIKQNWFPTLDAALESEGLLNTWDITMGRIDRGESASYHTTVNGRCRYVTIYRETDGRYERPVHCATLRCACDQF